MSHDARLAALGLILPDIGQPVANYVHGVVAGGLLFLAGKGPLRPDGTYSTGKVGAGVSAAAAREDARLTGLCLLAAMRQVLGSLDRVARIVKVLGMVNAVPEFRDHPRVIDGCSDLFVAVFGDAGRHARSAVGMGSLPFDTTVEIEAVVAVA